VDRGVVYFDDVLEGDVNVQGLRRDVRRLVADEPGLVEGELARRRLHVAG
jgi:hypothetical protein